MNHTYMYKIDIRLQTHFSFGMQCRKRWRGDRGREKSCELCVCVRTMSNFFTTSTSLVRAPSRMVFNREIRRRNSLYSSYPCARWVQKRQKETHECVHPQYVSGETMERTTRETNGIRLSYNRIFILINVLISVTTTTTYFVFFIVFNSFLVSILSSVLFTIFISVKDAHGFTQFAVQ
jgi:hypothetical protein